MNYSVTYAGLVVALVGFVLRQMGVPFVPEELDKMVYVGFELVGLVVAAFGRWRKGDVSPLGVKK